MSVACLMDKFKRPENLKEELFDQIARKTFVFVLLYQVIQRASELFEDYAEMVSMVKRFVKFYYSIMIFEIFFVNLFDDVSFDFGRLDVFLYGFDDLDYQDSYLDCKIFALVLTFEYSSERSIAKNFSDSIFISYFFPSLIVVVCGVSSFLG